MGGGPPYPFPPSSVVENSESDLSNIRQLDGGDSINTISDCSNNNSINSDVSSDDDSNLSDTEYDTEDEVFPEPVPANLTPLPGQALLPGQPIKLDVKQKDQHSSYLPLCMLLNARSIYNKSDNLTEFLQQIGPDMCIISETFEREKRRLSSVLNPRQFKSISNYRKNRAPGGGCAIVYNENRFSVSDLEIQVPDEIESCWALFTPKCQSSNQLKVKRIAVGSYYVSPRSRHKQEVIDHIIDTIHILRAKYDNDVSFLVGGDFNRLDISDILDSYGALKQIISVPTRKLATLEIILTDLHTMFHPPTTLPPLQVDTDKVGKDGDHEMVILAPINNLQYKVERRKKTIFTRPLPQSQIINFEKAVMKNDWEEKFKDKTVDEKVVYFHNFLRTNLDKYFPEKMSKMSNLDREWMSPELKQLHRSMQREFFKHRKSQKYKKLKSKFKKLKRKTVKCFFSKFVSDLKSTDPGKWYNKAKQIGAVDKMSKGDIQVQSLSHLNNAQCAQKIAEHFASISHEYSPVDTHQLPCYLPAQLPPAVDEYDVYNRLMKTKKTKSTLPIDIPDKLRQECSPHLAAPLTDIINHSLSQSVYPALWKHEWVTPAPKVTDPVTISDLRKISCTSDYSKLFEGYLKDWIMEDVGQKIDIGQFGGQPGLGTEHMIVCYLDRILHLLDTYPDRSAVIASSLDWSAAFDRQDPTLAIKKFIQLGVRPSLIPLLISYLSDRKMQVKFNGEISDILTLIGGGPQGTLVGGIEYLVQSNDNADIVPPEDRFKYIDDLSVLQLVLLSGLLVEYNFHQHVASDVGIGMKYLPAETYNTQDHLNFISNWTDENLMMLNEAKCSYMVFTRTKENFATRLAINNVFLERKSVTKILGVWISEDMSWSRNCQEICVKAYSRLSMITKLKYVGVSREDLLDIYILFIRSVTEYCAVSFHSSLTAQQSDKLEKIQKTCLKVIMGEDYVDYRTALNYFGLQTLSERRLQRCLDFSLKCIKHPKNSRLFPQNSNFSDKLKSSKPFKVNFARTSTYQDSAIPFCQKLLNKHFGNARTL